MECEILAVPASINGIVYVTSDFIREAFHPTINNSQPISTSPNGNIVMTIPDIE